jgi:hypothetical protein
MGIIIDAFMFAVKMQLRKPVELRNTLWQSDTDFGLPDCGSAFRLPAAIPGVPP